MGKERRFYPLVLQPGIQKDGSKNEGQTAIEGNWMRFQRGRAKTMGGITSSEYVFFKNRDGNQPPSKAGNYLTSLKAFSWESKTYLFVGYTSYLATSSTGHSINEVGFYIFEYLLNGDKNNQFNLYEKLHYKVTTLLGFPHLEDSYFLFDGPFTFNLTEDINQNAPQYNGDYFYAHLVHDSSNIIANQVSQLYLLDFNEVANDVELAPNKNIYSYNNSALKEYNFNGGVEVQENLFVVFGNGYFAYSTYPDFREYIISDSNAANIEGNMIQKGNEVKVTEIEPLPGSNQKIIQGFVTRGGGNSPTILFWSLTSLMRAINVSSDDTLNFRTDIVSNNCSIMSRDCVIEYDGLFFWMGIDRFFVYNGTVQEVPNTFNQNDLFENIDLDQRQNVVAAINAKYGEIWWFYPDKRYRPYFSLDGITKLYYDGNTAAIIYNKRENCWYSLENISRDCASFSSGDGFFFTGGCDDYFQGGITPKNYDFNANYAQIYIHDTPTMVKRTLSFNESTQSSEMIWIDIAAEIQTPFLSWKFTNPGQQVIGLNRQLNLISIEPDVKFVTDFEDLFLETDVQIKVEIQKKKFLLNDLYISSEVRYILPSTGQITYSTSSAGYISIKLTTYYPFELSTFLLEFEIDGEK